MTFDEKPFTDNEHLLYAHIALTNLALARAQRDLAKVAEMIGSTNIAHRGEVDNLVTHLMKDVETTQSQWEPVWQKYETRLNEEPPAATENS